MTMPDDPNKAEEMLKRYAKERRERESDFSLHPASRRMLQGEVKRQFGAPQARAAWLTRFGFWRSRFAAAAALVAVIFVGVWFFGRDSRSPRQEFAKATSPRVEKELFLARAERLTEAGKQPAPDRLNESAKTEVATRSLADAIEVQSKSMRVPVPSTALAPAQKPQSALDNVTLYRDASTGVAATSAFNYSVALAPAQNSQGAQRPPATATQLGFTAAQSEVPSLNAAQNAPGIPQFGVAVANPSPIANEPLALSDDAKLAKQSSLPLEQRGDVAYRAQQIAPPPVALSAVPPQSVAAPAPGSPVAAQIEEKLNRGGIGGLASASQIKTAPTPQRFYRFRSTDAEIQVAQRNAIDAVGGKKAESSDSSGSVLSQFTVEQEGNKLRWRDADGSVYEGTVATAAFGRRGLQMDLGTVAERDKDALTHEKTPVLKEKNAKGDEEFFFSVSGTNVTTRQLVTVSGRFAPNTNGLAGGGEIVAGRLTPQPQPTPQRPRASGVLQNRQVMIEGTLRVGESNEQRFQAVGAPR